MSFQKPSKKWAGSAILGRGSEVVNERYHFTHEVQSRGRSAISRQVELTHPMKSGKGEPDGSLVFTG